ncbi:MAG: hypothetical protein EA368_18440 [Leptolyngbya sp. DLM2.Bin27]|nr:MAG: hypothetical protein EA368_18440 [Leptolyngbya sp. DLM2.Bin27]
MPSPSQRRRRSAPGSQPRSPVGDAPTRLSSRRPFFGLWLVCGLLYAIAGTILIALPALPWLWLVAAAGAVVQGLALAGPQALQRFRWVTANLLVLSSIVGGTALAVALSMALNHLGTDNLDDLTIAGAILEVVVYSLLAAGLAVLCSLTTAALGDRLLRRYTGRYASLALIGTCLLGLTIGGGIGLLTT